MRLICQKRPPKTKNKGTGFRKMTGIQGLLLAFHVGELEWNTQLGSLTFGYNFL